MNHSKEIEKTNKLYSNYTIGLGSTIAAIVLPLILPILGSFVAPFLFIAGVVAILISKTNLIVRLVTVAIIIGILILFWNEYEALILNYMPNPME